MSIQISGKFLAFKHLSLHLSPYCFVPSLSGMFSGILIKYVLDRIGPGFLFVFFFFLVLSSLTHFLSLCVHGPKKFNILFSYRCLTEFKVVVLDIFLEQTDYMNPGSKTA